MTPKELIDFENEVCELYKQGKIKSPVHLNGSKDLIQEKELIKIFREIKKTDWVFTTYRSHYHALLKGISKKWLKQWILKNKSIHVMNKEHKIVSSAIVGGTLSQALGVAMAIKRDYPYGTNREEIEEIKKSYIPHVWCFIGDMAASLGVFNDCLTYSINNKLPITFIIENNELSTDTPSNEAWNIDKESFNKWFKNLTVFTKYIKYYEYKRTHPHYGILGKDGKRVIVNFEDKQEEIKT